MKNLILLSIILTYTITNSFTQNEIPIKKEIKEIFDYNKKTKMGSFIYNRDRKKITVEHFDYILKNYSDLEGLSFRWATKIEWYDLNNFKNLNRIEIKNKSDEFNRKLYTAMPNMNNLTYLKLEIVSKDTLFNFSYLKNIKTLDIDGDVGSDSINIQYFENCHIDSLINLQTLITDMPLWPSLTKLKKLKKIQFSKIQDLNFLPLFLNINELYIDESRISSPPIYTLPPNIEKLTIKLKRNMTPFEYSLVPTSLQIRLGSIKNHTSKVNDLIKKNSLFFLKRINKFSNW